MSYQTYLDYIEILEYDHLIILLSMLLRILFGREKLNASNSIMNKRERTRKVRK